MGSRSNIDCTQIPHQGWSARLNILQSADEGSNEAYHLTAGFYSTDLMFMGGALGNYVPGANNRRVYVEVSAAIATDSQHAEEEHCSDIRLAYQLTLDAVQVALNRVRAGNPYRWYDKRDKAMKAVRQQITQGMHPRLAALVNAAVNDHGTVNFHKFAIDLGNLYVNLAATTQNRDAQGWHFFEPERNTESYSMRSWLEYTSAHLMPTAAHAATLGDVKDIRRLVRGPQFSVNVTASPAVITL